jgi:SAM-dependent methyltransferase
VSRRDLLGLGLSRALEELPMVPPRHMGDAPARPTWCDLCQAPSGDPFGHRLDGAAGTLAARAGVSQGQRALDIGAAAGGVERALRARGADVEHAAAADALPFADDSFDAALSAFGVIYADDRARVLGELFRVVRPGGVVALTCWTRSGFMGTFLALVAKHAWPADAPDPTVWGRQERLRQDLEPFAGDAVYFDPGVVVLEFDSAATAWAEFADLPGPVAAGIDRLGLGERLALEAEFLDWLPEPRADGRVSVGVRLQLVVARACSAPGRST